MRQKIAVAVVHGIGKQTINFADRITNELDRRVRPVCDDDIVIRGVHWSPAVQDDEDELWRRVSGGGRLEFRDVRRLMIDLVADAIAYQITPHDRHIYDRIHTIYAETLSELADIAGPTAPLCVVAHSLGTIVSSNFFYDIQVDAADSEAPATVRDHMQHSPLEGGETLTLFYTLGCPLPLWSLRHENFGFPINVPDPRLVRHYPSLWGEWLNIYDKDDVIGYPLKTLNDFYEMVVTDDIETNIGSMATSWNPLSHLDYWTDPDAVDPIAEGLIRVWRVVNPDIAAGQ